MLQSFWREPMWFRILIPGLLIASIVLSSSAAADLAYADSLSKLAAAVFFGVFAFKLRYNRKIAAIFALLTLLCLYLAWSSY